MPEIRAYDEQYNFISPFAAYLRATEYECINCSQYHPVGKLCPDLVLGNSSGERNGKG